MHFPDTLAIFNMTPKVHYYFCTKSTNARGLLLLFFYLTPPPSQMLYGKAYKETYTMDTCPRDMLQAIATQPFNPLVPMQYLNTWSLGAFFYKLFLVCAL